MKRLRNTVLLLVTVIVSGTLMWEYAYQDYSRKAQEAEEEHRRGQGQVPE